MLTAVRLSTTITFFIVSAIHQLWRIFWHIQQINLVSDEPPPPPYLSLSHTHTPAAKWCSCLASLELASGVGWDSVRDGRADGGCSHSSAVVPYVYIYQPCCHCWWFKPRTRTPLPPTQHQVSNPDTLWLSLPSRAEPKQTGIEICTSLFLINEGRRCCQYKCGLEVICRVFFQGDFSLAISMFLSL